MENYNPLVSIVVITYDSIKYVLETLESVKFQTYQNIELIVSDDCSTDNTVDFCRKWLDDNKFRFIRTELITIEKNTGISSNCNRGCKAAKGEWIKLIAGDDALENYYLEHIIQYIKINPNALCLITNVTIYKELFTDSNVIYKTNLKNYKMFYNDITPEKQFQCLLRFNTVYTAGMIVSKKVYEDFDYYDEKYPFCEDLPFWLKITKSGIRIFLLDIFGAKYRVHIHSVQKVKNKIWSNFTESNKNITIDWIKSYPLFERSLRKLIIKIEYFFYKIFNNKRNIVISFMIYIITKIPHLVLNRINKKFIH